MRIQASTPLVPLLTFVAVTMMTACEGGRDTTASARRAAPADSRNATPQSTAASELAAGQRAYAAGDRLAALRHFRAAAEGGNADAQYYTGVMYADGQGVERDYAEAARWYEKAATQNQPDALMALARMHVLGLGVASDAAKALELYERAAKAYPPGEQRTQAEQQRQALLDVMPERKIPSPR